MATDSARHPLGSAELPISEPPNAGRSQTGEPATPFMRSSSCAEADMLLEMDAMQELSWVDIPQLNEEMDALLARIRTAGLL